MSGKAVPSAQVVVGIWPNAATALRVAKGAVVPMRFLAPVTSDAAGRFSVSIDVAALPADYREADGQIDVNVTAVGNRRVTAWATSLVRSIDGWRSTSGLPASNVDRLRLDLGPQQASATGAIASAKGDLLNASPALSCAPVDNGRVGPMKARWADIWAATDAKGGFNYTASTSHTLGVTEAFNGGGFSASGSSTKTAGGGFSTGYTVADAAVYGMWWYESYTYYCGSYTYTQLKPRNLDYGPVYSYSPHQRQAHCYTYYAGATFFRDRGSNYDYSTGVSVQGIGAESRAGWTSATTLSFRFSHDGQMCGSSSNGLWLSSRNSAEN